MCAKKFSFDFVVKIAVLLICIVLQRKQQLMHWITVEESYIDSELMLYTTPTGVATCKTNC